MRKKRRGGMNGGARGNRDDESGSQYIKVSPNLKVYLLQTFERVLSHIDELPRARRRKLNVA